MQRRPSTPTPRLHGWGPLVAPPSRRLNAAPGRAFALQANLSAGQCLAAFRRRYK
ncbi:MAG TPA: hypothetical protein VH599_21340 [Ktedonobacterales bacterium]